MIVRIIALVAAGISLGGCFQTLTGSVAGGESKVFERPPFVVLGKTTYDQDWVDSQIEGGVAAYGWKRPAPRPAYIDAPNRNKASVLVKMPKKKPSFIKRVKDKIATFEQPKPPAPGPVPYLNVTPPLVVSEPPPLPPQDPVDQLLSPR